MKPRTVVIAYTIPVAFEVPEDFPLTAKEIAKIVEWQVNDTTDGRQPFSTELMKDGARRAAEGHVEDAIFYHYCARVEKLFGPGWAHVEARNRLIDRLRGKVRQDSSHTEVSTEVRIYDATVICPGCRQITPAKWKTCPCGAKLAAQCFE